MGKIHRTFVDVQHGQVHVRIADGPTNAPPLVMLHHSPSSSLIFSPALASLSALRSVYAPDTPGYGDSDPPLTQPQIGDYAEVLMSAIDRLTSGPVDLIGYHTGASIAAEWAVKRPAGVRHLILLGAPLFPQETKNAMLGRRWPAPPEESGAHLVREWHMVMKNHNLPMSLEQKSRIFHEMFRGGETAWWASDAVAKHDLESVLKQINVPTLVLETADYLKGSGPKVAALVMGSTWEDWQHLSHGLFQAATNEVVTRINRFLAS